MFGNKKEEDILIEDNPIIEVYWQPANENNRFFKFEVGQRIPVRGEDEDIVIDEITFRKDRYLKNGEMVFAFYAKVNGISALWKEESFPPHSRVSVKYRLDF